MGNTYFWAKTTEDGHPGCTVREHALAAAEVARVLISLLPLEVRQMVPDGLLTLIAVHDVGKISPGFQTKCPQWHGPDGNADEESLRQWAKWEKNHAATSQWILEKYFERIYQKLRPWKPWAECVGAHHGRYTGTHHMGYLPAGWFPYIDSFLTDIQQKLGNLPAIPFREIAGNGKKLGKEEARVLQEWIIGLTEVADWIASNELYFPAAGGIRDLPQAARQALQAIGFSHQAPVEPGRTWEQLFPHAPTPHPLQRRLWEQPAHPGIYMIEDTMGGGKTEAALGLAYHLMEHGAANGLYFALPTQTTSNRIFLRVLDFLERAGAEVSARSLRLAHGNSWLQQEELFRGWTHGLKEQEDSPVRNWFASSRRALLSSFGVGTVDQALMAEINVRHSFVRRFALAGKVVILDEVHSYDVYTGSLLTKLVHHLRQLGASVIILSATLTRQRLQELLGTQKGNFTAYPLLSVSTGSSQVTEEAFPVTRQKNIRIIRRAMAPEESSEVAYRHAEQGQCVLWIRNTVKEAQEAYRTMLSLSHEGGPEIGLLHARFPLWRRHELEESWIGRLGKESVNRPPGCVLIATQVAEQSLDIDADFLMTELAPSDMLLQRAGRLWRHDRPLEMRHAAEAEMLVILPPAPGNASAKETMASLGPTGHVYAPYVLMRTHEVWQQRENIRLPEDVRSILEATYAEREEPEGSPMKDLYHDLQAKRRTMEDSASANMDKKMEPENDTDDASTRYGTISTTELLLLREPPQPLPLGQMRYVPLHGEPFTIDGVHWSFTAARTIRENTVRVPSFLVKDREQLPVITGYGFSPIYSVFLLDSATPGRYIGNIGWTAALGIYPQKAANAPHPPVEDDEEESLY